MSQDGILRTGVEDSTVIVKPRVSIDSHNHGPIIDQCMEQRLGPVARQLLPAIDSDPPCSLPWPTQRLRAASCLCSVRQLVLQRDAIVAHESVRQLASCAIASASATTMLRIWHTVNKRLRRDWWRRDAALLQLGLHGFHGRYSPTATTRALVTHAGATRSRQATSSRWRCKVCPSLAEGTAAHTAGVLMEERDLVRVHARTGRLVSVESLALFLRPVHEWVDASPPSPALHDILRIASLDGKHRFLKQSCAMQILCRSVLIGPPVISGKVRKRVRAYIVSRVRLGCSESVTTLAESQKGSKDCQRSSTHHPKKPS
mmetsp:Transcript_8880/g.16727  ORF Transcript_8880/g.16727 Transcript_8880/m.16727 type:complete len:316 (-) Transcript_8880:54-1001(-)